MTKLIHSSPAGALEIVGVPGAIEPGEPFEVTDEQAEALLAQADLYAVATKADIKKYTDRKAAEAEAAAKAAAGGDSEGAGE